jgi:hypothetical protein
MVALVALDTVAVPVIPLYTHRKSCTDRTRGEKLEVLRTHRPLRVHDTAIFPPKYKSGEVVQEYFGFVVSLRIC